MSSPAAPLTTSSHSEEDTPLFPASLLAGLDLATSHASFAPPLTLEQPGEDLRVRPLQIQDYDRGFLELLGQLTSVGTIGREAWQLRFNQMMEADPPTYLVTVIEDTRLGKVVGAATLVVERKFIHECGQVGRVEDVVVSDEYRGRQLGKLIVAVLQLLAQKLQCYKVTLNCSDKMVGFYQSLGYKLEAGNANYMCIRL